MDLFISDVGKVFTVFPCPVEIQLCVNRSLLLSSCTKFSLVVPSSAEVGKSLQVWVSEMAQLVKALATRHDDLNLIPRIHMVEGQATATSCPQTCTHKIMSMLSATVVSLF